MTVLDKIKDVFNKDKSSASGSSSAVADSPELNPPKPGHKRTSSTDIPMPTFQKFDETKVTTIFVLGGPGAGKGTQCEKLVRDYGFKHLSAGDLLRAEQHREGSTYGALIKEYITDGKIVPQEVTIKLLESAMHEAMDNTSTVTTNPALAAGWADGKGRFLIDGFPRKMDQALKFDEAVCESAFVLFFATTEATMLDRLMERGKTSGRDDDNEASIKKRFRTFEETSMPVVEYYRKKDKVVEIDSSPAVDQVYAIVRVAMDERLGRSGSVPVPTASAVPHDNALEHTMSASVEA